MEWPISTKEAAERAGVTPQLASILIRTHNIPTERIRGVPKFVGLMPEALELLTFHAAPFKAKRRTVASR